MPSTCLLLDVKLYHLVDSTVQKKDESYKWVQTAKGSRRLYLTCCIFNAFYLLNKYQTRLIGHLGSLAWLYIGLHPVWKYFTDIRMLPLPVKGFKSSLCSALTTFERGDLCRSIPSKASSEGPLCFVSPYYKPWAMKTYTYLIPILSKVKHRLFCLHQLERKFSNMFKTV